MRFRVFDTETGQHVIDNPDIMFFIKRDGVLYTGKPCHIANIDKAEPRYVRELCSNLEDKDDVPIYENDRLDSHGGPYVVIFEAGQFCMRSEDGKKTMFGGWHTKDNVKVIGHIHEGVKA